MGAYRDKNGRWFVATRYKNWTGETKQKTKRWFITKREALVWEREFLAKNEGSLDMTFGYDAFYLQHFLWFCIRTDLLHYHQRFLW